MNRHQILIAEIPIQEGQASTSAAIAVGMDSIFLVAVGATLGVMAWLLRSMWFDYRERVHKVESQVADLGNKAVSAVTDLERDFLKLKAELPITYIRSDDFIRFVNTLDAKLDHLNRKLDGFMEVKKTHE